MTAVELRQEAAKLYEQAGGIRKKAADEKRRMTSEEAAQFDTLHDRGDALVEDAKRIERQEQREKEMAEIQLRRAPVAQAVDRQGDEAYAGFEGSARLGPELRRFMPQERRERLNELELRAFRSWLRNGPEGMSEGERSLGGVISARDAAELLKGNIFGQRAQTVTTTGGGYLIPEGFQAECDIAMLAYGGMRDPAIVQLLRTSSGNPLPWPTINDSGNTGRLLTINTQVTTTDLVVGQLTLDAYKYSSDQILVPSELLQDSAIPVDQIVRDALAERLGRVTNNHLTVGDGSSKPNGIVTAATDSTVEFDISEIINPASTTREWINFTELEHSVDPAYRPGASYMMHDTMAKLVKLQLDSNGRPIFRTAEATPGAVPTINGYPVHINQDMPTAATATNKAVLFGNFKKYITRVVRPMVLFRLVERYRDYDQDGFFAFERIDGDLVDAGTHPVKYADMVA